MVDHISRKVWLILSLLVVSIAALWFLGFRMGLDLEGGTRLVYSIDRDKALEEGVITDEQYKDPDGLINELIGIWLERIDPNGVKGVTVRKEGVDHVVIELPGSAAATRRDVKMPVGSEVGAEDVALYLQADTFADEASRKKALDEFPATGGLISIGNELIRYGKRVGNKLERLERAYGQDPSEASPHSVGDIISLKASDPWRQLIENTGQMEFMIEANADDLRVPGNPALSTDLIAERENVVQWIAENPGISIKDYNTELATRQPSGPANRLRWYPMSTEDPEAQLVDLIQPLILEEKEEWRFSGRDFPTFFQSQDQLGFPAVGFASVPEKRGLFGAFTTEHVGERMAIVINDEIATFPNINGPLRGSGIIEGGEGGFTATEVNDLVKVLRSGSLNISPQFEAQETVGATLGADYVRRGFTSAIIGLITVLIFMMFYYRRLGVLAGMSLVFNLVLLLGAMAFIRATLTLPGVAGIILTVGMAVDANILIYERIREEALKGRKPLQSARDGFKNATSTILDANITTLITGLILYKFGTGPVKGFATTLCIGIITSLMSVLILTRLLVHLALEKGVENWSMQRWVTETKINFIDKAKAFIPVSLILMVAGVGLFSILPWNDKMGIDFTGGTTMTIRTAEAQSTDSIRDLFDASKNSAIRAGEMDSVQVQAIVNSGNDEDGFRSFRIMAKTADTDQTALYQNVLEFADSVLQAGPIEAEVTDGQAQGRLYFDTPHDTEAIVAALAKCNIGEPTVTETADDNLVYNFTGRVSKAKSADDVKLDIQTGIEALKDKEGSLLSLTSPISELQSVGAQVVEDLRDKAVLAIILSLFAAVMYIRVRFAEYSYGFAAVLALVHDVSITLGALGLMIWTGLVQAEIGLPMIAAFLTIIGYSLNDTIVVFDRVRENLPRMKGSMKEIVNKSINQTLSRTMLTSVTTLITVSLLFGFNVGTGNVIEGLSFALIIGVIVGTYSSMFIASPALVWLETRRQKSLAESVEAEAKTSSAAG